MRGRREEPEPERALRPRSLGVGTVCLVKRLDGDLQKGGRDKTEAESRNEENKDIESEGERKGKDKKR